MNSDHGQKNIPSKGGATPSSLTASASSKKKNNQKNRKNNNKRNRLSSSSSSTNTQLSRALSWVLRHAAPSLHLPMSSDGYVPISAILSCHAKKLHTYSLEDVLQVVSNNDKQRFKLEKKFVIWHHDNTNSSSNSNSNNNKTLRYSFVNDSKDGNVKDNNNQGQEELCIRANQGHSIKNIINCEELLTPIPSEELQTMTTIIHGTTKNAWTNHIQHDGLNKMKRNHIHFAPGLPDNGDVISGMRKSCDVHIYINGSLCAQDGIQFYKSDNGVILTSGVDYEYEYEYEHGYDDNDGHGKRKIIRAGTLPCKYFSKVVDARTNKTLSIPVRHTALVRNHEMKGTMN